MQRFRRSLIALAGAATLAAALLPQTAMAQAKPANYKSEYKMSLVLGTAFPWGKGGELWANKVRDLFVILREAGELSAVILLVVSLAGIFAYSLSTLGVIDPVAKAITNSGLGEYGVLALLIVMLITVGMFLDGVSIFLIFVPLLWPIVQFYKWDPVWFGVILTLKVALGQFTPPLAVNLMVSCRIANVRMEETERWVGWMLFAMFLVMVAVIAWPQLALWLPARLGY